VKDESTHFGTSRGWYGRPRPTIRASAQAYTSQHPRTWCHIEPIDSFDTTIATVNLESINLNLMVALDSLLSERNVTRAAQRTGVTQSTMSYSLARLRELFEDQLLVRRGAGLMLTPFAEQIAGGLHAGLAELRGVLTARERFDPASSRRRFRIAVSDGFQIVALAPLLELMQARAPRADLVVRPVAEASFEALAHGRLDAVIASVNERPDPKVGVRELLELGYVCIVRRKHPLVGHRMGIRTFCQLPHALVANDEDSGLVDRLLAPLGRSRRVALRVPDYAGLGHVVASTNMVATVPELVGRRFAELMPIAVHRPPIALPRMRICLYYHLRQESEAGSRWLRDQVVRVIEAL
jgi:DNA-binding transcriptional LysR family regulator